jgi:hypothetical protein
VFKYEYIAVVVRDGITYIQFVGTEDHPVYSV